MTLQRYETATEWPLTGLAVAFLVAYAWPILDPDLDRDVVAALGVLTVAVLDAERDSPEANITSFPDALWWAATTVTTVGYGDRFPTTGEGRWVAVGLMLAGIALLGVVTAALASWFVERLNRVEAAGAETRDDLAELTAEVRRLRAAIDERRGSGQPNS